MMYILNAYIKFKLKIFLELKSYLATIVILSPENGDVDTVVDHAIKKVKAKSVWFTSFR